MYNNIPEECKTNKPFVAVRELHVHRVTTEEGFCVQGDLDVRGVRDGVADQNQVRGGRLRLPVGSLVSLALVQADVA